MSAIADVLRFEQRIAELTEERDKLREIMCITADGAEIKLLLQVTNTRAEPDDERAEKTRAVLLGALDKWQGQRALELLGRMMAVRHIYDHMDLIEEAKALLEKKGGKDD